MFRRKSKTQADSDLKAQPAGKTPPNWLKISVIGNIVILALVLLSLGGMAVVYQSDTNPAFCATCHLMDSHVQSYLTSGNLDNMHALAKVECKDCHEYPVPAEIASGINYLVGNYEVDGTGELLQRGYTNEMCLQCHISYDHLGQSTDFLDRNPHLNHNGELPCRTCHISHGEQIDYCSQCHENGGQRMIGADSEPKAGAEQ